VDSNRSSTDISSANRRRDGVRSDDRDHVLDGADCGAGFRAQQRKAVGRLLAALAPRRS
jgi:hypothetical protein